MQTDTKQSSDEKQTRYDHTLKDDKHFFGGFLNLAENNLESIRRIYTKRFKVTYEIQEKDNIKVKYEELLNKIKELSESDYIEHIEYLKQYLPVISFLELHPDDDQFAKSQDNVQASKEYVTDNLILLIRTIHDLRNFYSHYQHNPLKLDSKLYILIDDILLNVAQKVRKAKKERNHTRQFLMNSLKEEFDILKEKKTAQIEEKKLQGKKVCESEECVENSVFDDAFSHFIYKPNNTINELLNNRYSSKFIANDAENGITISKNGLIFLMGMFLSRKESKDLRSRVTDYKGNVIKDLPDFPNDRQSSLKFMATHWIYEYLNIKTIRPKLNTGFTKERLLSEIVDYLTKVPEEVYKNLSFKLQQTFVEDTNTYYNENDAEVVHNVTRKRYEDRFNYFALRYLDEFGGFDKLRFQIHIGNYIHHTQSKEIKGTHFTTERKITERIKVFGKLSEVAELKTKYIDSLKGNDDTGWEEFPNPSYNIVRNNIPIYFDLGQYMHKLTKYKNIRIEDEDREPRKKRLDKQQVVKQINAEKIIVAEPTAILSLNELPALLYELLVKKSSPKMIQKILIEGVKDRINILETYKPGVLANNQIPKKLNKSSDIARINKEKLLRAIQTEIDNSTDKINLIQKHRDELKDRKKKPPRNYVFYAKEIGTEAAWLADDLKRFMPIPARKNWKGYQHSQLQQSLAYFNQKPGEAFEMLKTVWDFADIEYIWNRGIKKAFTNNKFFDEFYEEYLLNRKKSLIHLYENLKNFKDDDKLGEFINKQKIDTPFYLRLYIIDTTSNIKNKLLAKPIVFPRGIFDEKPTFHKGKNIIDHRNDFADWYVYQYDQHSYQDFYNLPLDYTKNFDKALDDKKSYINKAKHLTWYEKRLKFTLNEDMNIKKVKGKDVYLNLMANKLFEDVFGHNADFTLNDLYKDRQERMKQQADALKQNSRQKGDASPNIHKESFIWDKKITYIISPSNDNKKQSKEEVKLKDVGKVKTLLNDERVKLMLEYEYNIKKTWSVQGIKDELFEKKNSYERLRSEKILMSIHQFEKFILGRKNVKSSDFEDDKNHPNFKLYVAKGALAPIFGKDSNQVEWIKNLGTASFNGYTSSILDGKEEEVKKAFLLIAVRNKIAHNQLPVPALYKDILKATKDTKGLNTTEVLEKYANEAIEYFQNIIKNN